MFQPSTSLPSCPILRIVERTCEAKHEHGKLICLYIISAIVALVVIQLHAPLSRRSGKSKALVTAGMFIYFNCVV